MSVCNRVFSVGFGPGLDSMSPARSWRSASHAVGSHDWFPQKHISLQHIIFQFNILFFSSTYYLSLQHIIFQLNVIII